MGRVHAVVARRDIGKCDHLVGAGVGPGDVDQPGGETDGAVAHRRFHQPLHRGELLRGGGTVVAAHDLPPHGVVPDQRGEVGADPERLEAGEERRQVGRGAAAVARHHRRDPVTQVVGGVRELLDALLDVGVHVDEPRREYELARLDHPRRRPPPQRADRRDPSVLDAHVGAEPRAAGAVDDPSTRHQEVEIRRQQRCRRQDQKREGSRHR